MGAAPGGTSGSGDEHTRAALLASQHVVQKAEALCERIGAKLMVRQTATVVCALPRCPAHHDDGVCCCPVHNSFALLMAMITLINSDCHTANG